MLVSVGLESSEVQKKVILVIVYKLETGKQIEINLQLGHSDTKQRVTFPKVYCPETNLLSKLGQAV